MSSPPPLSLYYSLARHVPLLFLLPSWSLLEVRDPRNVTRIIDLSRKGLVPHYDLDYDLWFRFTRFRTFSATTYIPPKCFTTLFRTVPETRIKGTSSYRYVAGLLQHNWHFLRGGVGPFSEMLSYFQDYFSYMSVLSLPDELLDDWTEPRVRQSQTDILV